MEPLSWWEAQEEKMKRRKPWESRKEETPLAFRAFVFYLEQGHTRSLERTAELMGKPPGYISQLKEWSSKNGWVERTAAWDKHVLDLQLRARSSAIERARQRYVDAIEGLSVLVLQLATDSLKSGREVPASVQFRAAIHAQTMAGLLPPPQRVEMTGRDGEPLRIESTSRDYVMELNQDPDAAKAIKLLALRSAALAIKAGERD